MKVKATKLGFYDGRRVRPGEIFEVKDGLVSRWFVPVEEAAPPPDPQEPAETPEPAVKRKKTRRKKVAK